MTESVSSDVEVIEEYSQELSSAFSNAGLTTPAIQRMEAEARALQTAYTIANSMSKSKTVLPDYQRAHRPKLRDGSFGPELGDQAAINGAAAIMYGSALGIGAVQSLKLVHTIGSSCGIEARTMQALCEARGVRFDFMFSSSERCVVAAERPDHKPVSSEWTMQRAEQAKYTSNKLYQSHPLEMLRAKAIAECCRLIAPDIILGLDYSVEELRLSEEVTVQRVRQAPRGGVSGLQALLADRQKPQVEQATSPVESAPPSDPVEPQADPTTEPDPVVAAEVVEAAEQQPELPEPVAPANSKPASTRQITEVKRALAVVEKLTNTGSADALGLLSSLACREVTDIDELTSDEADMVVAEINKKKES